MSKRLLLCDDEIHILRAAEFKLARAGYLVRCAHNGREAWERVQEELPDMVITDLQMPELDGVGLIRRLRSDPRTQHLPIVMLTAKGYELSAESARDWGISAILTKPFSPRALLQFVDETLQPALA